MSRLRRRSPWRPRRSRRAPRETQMARPNVFTIPAGVRFLDTLVGALLDGRLITGFDAGAPFALADTTIYLPTRRAARAIRESFLRHLGRPLLLPRIRTLGDLDEDEAAIAGLDGPRIPARRLRIGAPTDPNPAGARVVRATGAASCGAAGRGVDRAGVPGRRGTSRRTRLPASWTRWARTRRHGVGLREKVPADLARYWDITLDVPADRHGGLAQHLNERGMIDPGTRRDLTDSPRGGAAFPRRARALRSSGRVPPARCRPPPRSLPRSRGSRMAPWSSRVST